MSEFTEQQVREIEAVEAKFGSYGQLVHGVGDASLTDSQCQHCLRVFKTGVAAFGAELAAEHGEQYPLSALAAKIDGAIAKHTIQREVSA